jgi:hypothetical protein
MRNNFNVTVSIDGDDRVLGLLEQLPKSVLFVGGPLDKAVQAALNIIARRARQLAPRSNKTGTRFKMSKKSRAKWMVEMRSTIRTKVVKLEFGRWGIVGPKNPQGNAAHFMQEKPRRHVLWGKATMIKKYRIERNWITQAYDETASEQQTAIYESLKQSIDSDMRAG